MAGKVWDFLETEGNASVSAVCKGVNGPQTKVNMAIGWLAREGKLEFEAKGRGSSVKLKE